MMLNRGVWDGRQIVPEQWLEQIGAISVRTPFGSRYSNLWYLSRQYAPGLGRPVPLQHAAGNGGQRLYLLPEQDMVVCILCGSYNLPNDWMTPNMILHRIILSDL